MSEEMTIRLAGDADVERVLPLVVAFRDFLRQDEPSEQQFRTALTTLLAEPATEVALAEDLSGSAVGYLVMRYRFSAWVPGPSAELEDIFVSAAARGGGLGRRLVDFALARAHQRGCRLVSVTTNERNEAAVALYRLCGFRAERARWDGGRALWLERWNGA